MCPDVAPQADPKPASPPEAPAAPASSQESAAPAGKAETPSPSTSQPAEPAPDQDLLRLESFDWRRAVVLRLQNGRHPDPVIEDILRRRLDLDREEFQGPLPVRVLCTLAFVFIACIIAWIAGWSAFSLLGWDGWVLGFSGLMTTVLAVALGVAAFQPVRIYDEIGAVAKAQQKFDELRRHVDELRYSKRRSRS
ncbi:hypothetical protein KBA41_11710 [Candidatus Ozemobacteraceae bacterium]|nr:hypothetical protein [Candidatus Ozemobacteraceae bacterium]